MEDSMKGLLVSVTAILIFMTAILNFIVIFPQEQGVTFSGSAQAGYLIAQNSSNLDIEGGLSLVNNQSSSGFNEWDITQGYMGSNALKQGSKAGINSYSNNIFTNLKLIATQLFGANSPVVWVITVLLSLFTTYLVYLVIKWIRTGN